MCLPYYCIPGLDTNSWAYKRAVQILHPAVKRPKLDPSVVSKLSHLSLILSILWLVSAASLTVLANTKEIVQQSMNYHCSHAAFSAVSHQLLFTNFEILKTIAELEANSKRFRDLTQEQERLHAVLTERSKEKGAQ